MGKPNPAATSIPKYPSTSQNGLRSGMSRGPWSVVPGSGPNAVSLHSPLYNRPHHLATDHGLQTTDPTMKLGLINSAWAQAGRDTAYGIRMTKEIGFDTIDIFADPLDLNVKERRRIAHECEKAGLPIVSI